ncbi:MAG: hypothetical protein ACJAXA_003098 [Candidatus Aldehydirespiratoraceae bacterium]|jgi:hypothetical protein
MRVGFVRSEVTAAAVLAGFQACESKSRCRFASAAPSICSTRRFSECRSGVGHASIGTVALSSGARCLLRRRRIPRSSDSLASARLTVRACGPSSSMSSVHDLGMYTWFKSRPRLSALPMLSWSPASCRAISTHSRPWTFNSATSERRPANVAAVPGSAGVSKWALTPTRET